MTTETRKQLLTMLRDANIDKVVMTVQGCGDSGEVDWLEFIKNEAPIERANISNALWKFTSDTLYEVVTEFDADFWNNDGGDGEITLDVKTKTYTAYIDVNETVSTRVVDHKNEAFVD